MGFVQYSVILVIGLLIFRNYKLQLSRTLKGHLIIYIEENVKMPS